MRHRRVSRANRHAAADQRLRQSRKHGQPLSIAQLFGARIDMDWWHRCMVDDQSLRRAVAVHSDRAASTR